MTTTTETEAARGAPWHFWVVVAVAVLWNGFGGYDYTMSHLQGEAYYRQAGMTDAQIAMMAAYPTWMHAVWAVGVWGSVLGSILLIARSKWAFHAFAVSFLGVIGNIAYTLTTPQAMETMGVSMMLAIGAICAAFIWYAWTMTKRGVLR